MNQSKGDITAVNSRPQDVELVNLHTPHDVKCDQNNLFNLDYDVADQIYDKCSFDELKYRYEMDGLDITEIYSANLCSRAML